MKGYFVTFFLANLIHQAVQEPERRYACWGSFGPPVISAQCPRGTVIQVLKAGLKVKSSTGPCVYKEEDCGCEYGQPACNMDRVRERCMGRPACRLDVTQQYINTPTCTGFSDYMYIEFNCVSMETRALHDICVTDVTVSKTGFIRSPNYPTKYPKNRYCLCNLRTLPEHSVKVSILDLNRQNTGQECIHSKLFLQHDKDERLLCGSQVDDMREFDTGRASITVVMETDEVATSGGFWLKYEAIPEAMVQMECFGQFAKEDGNGNRKPNAPTVIMDARSGIIGQEDSAYANQNASDISNESMVQSTGLVEDGGNDVIVKDISATLKRVQNAVLSAKDNEGATNVDIPLKTKAVSIKDAKIQTQQLQQQKHQPQQQRQQQRHLPRPQQGQELNKEDFSVSEASREDANRQHENNPDEEPFLPFGEDYSDAQGKNAVDNKNLTDEEFDSIIQTILAQIEEQNDDLNEELGPDDTAREELLVDIAQLMVNELSDGEPAAEVAPSDDELQYRRIEGEDYPVPLEYDSLEELLARDRLQSPAYDGAAEQEEEKPNAEYGTDKRRRLTGQRRYNGNVLPAVADGSPPAEGRRTLNSNGRRKIVHHLPNDRSEVRAGRVAKNGDRTRLDDEQPWWFQFTLKDDDYAGAAPSHPLNRNPRRRTDAGRRYPQMDAERRHGVPAVDGGTFVASNFDHNVLGDSPRLVDHNGPPLSISNRQLPVPSRPRPNPGKDDSHLKADKVIDTPSSKSTQEDKHRKSGDEDPEDSMTVTLIVAGAIGSVLFVIVVGVLIKFAVKRSHPRPAWRRRHPPSVLRRHPYLHKHPSLT